MLRSGGDKKKQEPTQLFLFFSLVADENIPHRKTKNTEFRVAKIIKKNIF
jgi:hypothetical protein